MISVSEAGGFTRTLALVLLCTASAGATADDRTRAAARQLAQDGAAAYDVGDFERARALLRRAYSLVPAPTITLLEGRALFQLGRWVEAAERFEDARRTRITADSSDAFRQAVRDSDRELEELRPRIPLLTIRVVDASDLRRKLRVELDGRSVPDPLLGVRQPVDPGVRRVVLKDGVQVLAEQVFEIKEREQRVVTLDASAAAAPESPWPVQRTAGFVALGAGLAGLTTGVIAGAVMLNKKERLDDACVPTCPPSADDDLSGFRSARTVSFVGYGLGFLGLGAGGVLLLTAPPTTRAGIVPTIGAGHVGVRGAF